MLNVNGEDNFKGHISKSYFLKNNDPGFCFAKTCQNLKQKTLDQNHLPDNKSTIPFL
jgi:hypothetical protein